MSQRGRALFDNYVRKQLKHPLLGGVSIQSHVHNLLYEAGAPVYRLASLKKRLAR